MRKNKLKTPASWTKLSKSEKKEFNEFRKNLPENLKKTGKDYDLTGAWKGGLRPEYVEEDKSYHMGSRNPNTGKYYKSVKHPTAAHAAKEDRKIGYEPVIARKGLKKSLYTGSKEDPAKVDGKIIKTGDKAIKYLERKTNKKSDMLKPGQTKTRTTANKTVTKSKSPSGSYVVKETKINKSNKVVDKVTGRRTVKGVVSGKKKPGLI